MMNRMHPNQIAPRNAKLPLLNPTVFHRIMRGIDVHVRYGMAFSALHPQYVYEVYETKGRKTGIRGTADSLFAAKLNAFKFAKRLA